MYNVSYGTTDRGRIDRFTAGLYLVFLFLGWLSVYAASYDLENAKSLFDLSGRAGMQLIWIGTSLVLAFALMKSDTGFFETYAFVFYAFGIVLLIITLAIAPEIKGSRSWLVLGPVRLQPAEFMKFVIALALARVFNTYGFRLLERKNLLLVLAIILLPTALVIAQSETGTALVYLSLLLVLFREGMPGAVLLIGVALVLYFVLGIKFSDIPLGSLSRGEFISILLIILFSAGMVWSYMKRKEVLSFMLGIPFVVFLIALTAGLFGIEIDYGLVALIALCGVFLYVLYLALRFRKRTYLLILIFMAGSFAFLESAEYMFNDVLKPHQQMRIKVTLGMERDLQGAGYHVEQSKIAIGSGGLWGKGFLNGTQTKLKYVPEQDTDFIFCTIGEEMGFVGSSIILLLYLIFILRLIYLAERQTSVFGRVYGYGVASIFIFHVMVNIGMVVGILPVIGIPLPFFSYGGSSLWGFTILLFIFLRIDKARRI
ncbi:MAG: rod shape determining protein RodA [Bacteroidota bacterium]|nr:rod shape determining protein RodA [Bacteroidota bacterium]